MTVMKKLTKPQQKLLDEITNEPRHVEPDYRPARKLVELGLAHWEFTDLLVAGPPPGERLEILSIRK